MLTSSEIRRQFLDYFKQKHGHAFVPSSPVVPHDDPTLLFANAGMNQFKDVFLGTGTRPYTRAVNTQKCIRAGGKHNDLEDVGRDTYHHTFFEMLGNWSFGDYFKKEAIAWAWDLLTNVWGLEKDRLYVTVFEGDADEGLDPDREAAELWASQTDIDASHILQGSKKDNFWEMGDTGPCGPCSEIHYDLTPDKTGGTLVNAGDPRVIEIWNLVFIQYNRNGAGLLTPLPASHVDTGMGFERIVAVLQGKASNYDTDVFAPLFEAIREGTGARAYGTSHAASEQREGAGSTAEDTQPFASLRTDVDDPIDVAYRIIADHIRCLTFALTDGAMPSNEGRGYVLRRILRRAFRYGWQTFNTQGPFLYKLVPAVVETMGQAFPELRKHPAAVADTIREEEESFGRTIARGIDLFEEAAARSNSRLAGAAQPPVIPADDAFKLYDTYGFPLDLTQVMAQERGMDVDVAGFNRLMEEARQRSRTATAGQVDARQSLIELVQQQHLPPTTFLGYERTETMPEPMSLKLFVAGERGYHQTKRGEKGEAVAVVVDRTPFYAEAGGQVADIGVIQVAGGGRVKVENTVRIGEVIFHLGRVALPIEASPEPAGANIALAVERDRRMRIMANHTATHLMNHKLRAQLGDHVQQKGSLVDENRLRFDFSHTQPVTPEQIERIEQRVNADIAADLPVYFDNAPQEQARNINTLRAVFGEKYPPIVRIVSIGMPPSKLLEDPPNEKWYDYSVEFCGGTHLARTSEARDFVIVSEEGVAKGVRRITALTGLAAEQARYDGKVLLNRLESLEPVGEEAEEAGLRNEIAEISSSMSQTPIPLAIRTKIQSGIAELQQELKELEKQRTSAQQADVVELARAIAEDAAGGARFSVRERGAEMIIARLDGVDAAALRTAMDVIRKKRPEAALLLAGTDDGKVAVIAAVPADKIKQGLKAGDWVREAAKIVGGGGGGRPDMAQAGGKDPAKLDEALDAAREFARKSLGSGG